MTVIIDEHLSAETIDDFIAKMARELLEAADDVEAVANSKKDFQDGNDGKDA